MTKRQYRLKPDKPDPRDFLFKAAPPAALPSRIDLRATCSPIVDQGSLGSCTANAIASGLREYLLLAIGSELTQLSRLYLYWHERNLEGTVNEDSGAYIRDGMKVLQQRGCAPEELQPYDINKFTLPPSAAAEAAAPPFKIPAYHRITDLTGVKAALAKGLPVVIGIAVYESFESFNVSMDGNVPMPDKTKEKLLGGHALLIVGYDDTKQQAIVRNSWGATWGDHGYCYLPYAYFADPELTYDLWTADMDVPTPDPVPSREPWADINVDQAVRIIADAKFADGVTPLSDSPDFWLNLAFKYQDDPDSDFRFVGLQMRKFAAYLQGK
jgi:C1A family cysteine protease